MLFCFQGRSTNGDMILFTVIPNFAKPLFHLSKTSSRLPTSPARWRNEELQVLLFRERCTNKRKYGNISSPLHYTQGGNVSQRVIGKCSCSLRIASWESDAGSFAKANSTSKPLQIQVRLLGVYSTLSKCVSSGFMNPNNLVFFTIILLSCQRKEEASLKYLFSSKLISLKKEKKSNSWDEQLKLQSAMLLNVRKQQQTFISTGQLINGCRLITYQNNERNNIFSYIYWQADLFFYILAFNIHLTI